MKRTDVSIMIHDKSSAEHVARMKDFTKKDDPIVFKLFDAVHILTADHAIVTRITKVCLLA